MTIAVFDLDHTLLNGDSDVLWCDFLFKQGVLGEDFRERNHQMEREYKAGTVSPTDFTLFYLSTLKGRSAAQWQALREQYFKQEILPRIGNAARVLVETHRQRGDRLIMSTATNRFLTELTANDLGFSELLATDLECDAQGVFTGRALGVMNMREGKVTRLQSHLGVLALNEQDITFYSDSSNDLPLLKAVNTPVVVDPDARLLAFAKLQGWAILPVYQSRA